MKSIRTRKILKSLGYTRNKYLPQSYSNKYGSLVDVDIEREAYKKYGKFNFQQTVDVEIEDDTEFYGNNEDMIFDFHAEPTLKRVFKLNDIKLEK